MNILRNAFVLFLIFQFIVSCQSAEENGRFKVVTTTNMITDLVRNIGGDSVEVIGLMGAGVDPHLYKAREGDVSKLTSSDAIFYNGFHLEGKMADVFEEMKNLDYNTFALSEAIPIQNRISSSNFSENYDPHIWFSIDNWRLSAQYVSEKLSELQPQNQAYFEANFQAYDEQLRALKSNLMEVASVLPKDQRVLVTAHDAFSYFGKEFDFEVVGLQGISTTTEAGTRDMLQLAEYIVERKIPAIFIESSVPEQTILALQKAVESKGGNVSIGGTLYSDSLGDENSDEGNYIGMYLKNMQTIVNALHVEE